MLQALRLGVPNLQGFLGQRSVEGQEVFELVVVGAEAAGLLQESIELFVE